MYPEGSGGVPDSRGGGGNESNGMGSRRSSGSGYSGYQPTDGLDREGRILTTGGSSICNGRLGPITAL